MRNYTDVCPRIASVQIPRIFQKFHILIRDGTPISCGGLSCSKVKVEAVSLVMRGSLGYLLVVELCYVIDFLVLCLDKSVDSFLLVRVGEQFARHKAVNKEHRECSMFVRVVTTSKTLVALRCGTTLIMCIYIKYF